jgi:hypothetical protein
VETTEQEIMPRIICCHETKKLMTKLTDVDWSYGTVCWMHLKAINSGCQICDSCIEYYLCGHNRGIHTTHSSEYPFLEAWYRTAKTANQDMQAISPDVIHKQCIIISVLHLM